MVDSRLGSETRRYRAEGPLLGQAKVGPLAPYAVGEAPDCLGRQRRASSAPTTGKTEELLDRRSTPRARHSQETSRALAMETNDSCPSSSATRNLVTPQERGHC